MDQSDIERFLASHPLSASTRETYRRILTRLINLPDLEHLTAAQLVKFVDQPNWGNSWQYVSLVASRKFLVWMFGQSHPAQAARIKRTRPRRQRVLSAGRALDLLASFNTHTAKGSRDLAIAALALDTGLRCSELCRLRLADVDLVTRVLQVIVKGGQWAAGVFSEQTALYIHEWIAFRATAPGAETLFTSTRSGRPLTRNGLQTIVKKWGLVVGIKISPHDLRRSFATLSTIFGAPSRVVQIAGRWSDIGMVERYTQSIDPDCITPFLPVSHLKR